MVSALLSLMLAVFLIIIGFVSGSKAILANSLYAVKDFVTSMVVFIGIRASEKPPDGAHPYGHGKIEFVAMLFIGVAILIACMFLLVHSVRDVWTCFYGQLQAPESVALWAGCISVIANYKLYKYLLCVGTRQNHPSILAIAKHHHSDAIASFFVVLAIIGAKMGLLFLDPLVAVIETIDLMRLSVVMLKDGLNGVLDRSVNVEIGSEITSIAELVPGVRRVSKLNTRQLGQGLWVDLTIKVDYNKSASEGYMIGLQVKESIIKGLPDISHVSVSVEPYVP